MKKFMMLSIALMIGTSCFAMDADDQAKKVTAKPTTTETKRVPEETAQDYSTATTTALTPFLFESLPNDVSQPILLNAAIENIEYFKNMILVSSNWFGRLTGTGDSNPYPDFYPKQYVWIFNYKTGVDAYTTSKFLKQLHQIKLNRGLAPMDAREPLNFTFPTPKAITYLDVSRQQIGEFGMNSIKLLQNLRTINLRCNNLTTHSLLSLSGCTALESLNLGENILLDVSPLSNLTTLTHLNLAYNNTAQL